MLKNAKAKVEIERKEDLALRTSKELNLGLIELPPINANIEEFNEVSTPHHKGGYSITKATEERVCPFFEYCMALELSGAQVQCLGGDKLICRNNHSIVAV